MNTRKLILISIIPLLFFASCATNKTYDETTPINGELNSANNLDIVSGSEIIESIDIVEMIEYHPGTWNGNQFSSEWYGFSFVALPNMKTISEKDLKIMNAQQSRAFDGPGAESYAYEDMKIVYEVMSATEDGRTSVTILTEKSFKDDLTVEEYADILQKELKVTHGRNIEFAENVFTTIGNYDYYTLTAKINIEGKTSYKSICLHGAHNRFATVLFDYTEESQFAELLTQFEIISH